MLHVNHPVHVESKLPAKVTFVRKRHIEDSAVPEAAENEDSQAIKVSKMNSDIDKREAMFALKLSAKVCT